MFSGQAHSTVQQNANRKVKTAIMRTCTWVRSIPERWSVASDCWFCRQHIKG